MKAQGPLNYSSIKLPDGLTDAGYESLVAHQIRTLMAYNRTSSETGLLGGVVTIKWAPDPSAEHGVLLATWEKVKL